MKHHYKIQACVGFLVLSVTILPLQLEAFEIKIPPPNEWKLPPVPPPNEWKGPDLAPKGGFEVGPLNLPPVIQIDPRKEIAEQMRRELLKSIGDLATHIADIRSKISGAQSLISQLNQTIKSTTGELECISREIEQTQRWAFTLAQPFNAVLNQLRELLPDLDIQLYDITTNVTGTYNASSGMPFMKVMLPQGVSVDQTDMKSAISSGNATPQVDPVRLIESVGMVDANLTSDFDDFEMSARRDKEFVYVSSRRFSDEVSLETLANDLVLAIFSGGQTLIASAQALEYQIVLEWADIRTWAENVGAENANKLATDAMSLIRGVIDGGGGGDLAVWPEFKLALSQPTYSYSVEPKAFGKTISEVLNFLGIDPKVIPTSVSIDVPHLAFLISTELEAPSNVDETLRKFQDLLANGPSEAIKLPSDAIAELRLPAAEKIVGELTGDSSLRLALHDVFDKSAEKLSEYHVGNLVFDFTESPFSREMEGRLSSLAFGNQRSAKIRRFVFDGGKMSVEFVADLNHRHSIGTVRGLAQDIFDSRTDALGGVERAVTELLSLQTRLLEDAQRLNEELANGVSELGHLTSELNRQEAELARLCSVDIFGVRVSHASCP